MQQSNDEATRVELVSAYEWCERAIGALRADRQRAGMADIDFLVEAEVRIGQLRYLVAAFVETEAAVVTSLHHPDVSTTNPAWSNLGDVLELHVEAFYYLDIVETRLYNNQVVSPKELTAFRIDPDLMAGLRTVKDRDGIPLSVQVHRALVAWLESRGVKTKTAPRRAGTRRKA